MNLEGLYGIYVWMLFILVLSPFFLKYWKIFQRCFLLLDIPYQTETRQFHEQKHANVDKPEDSRPSVKKVQHLKDNFTK